MLKRNKAFRLVLLICSMMFVVTGCNNQIPEMTEEENALITEYAAGLLLQYHADYDGRLVDTSVPPEINPVVQEPAVEETVSENTAEEEIPNSDSTVSSNGVGEIADSSLNISQVIGAEGFDIVYRAYEVCDKYPSNDSSPEELFFSMKAGQGNKLLVLKLEITNTQAQEMVFDTLSMTDIDCKIIINGSNTQRAYVSMLENDFMAVNRNFGAGEVYESVIITEMSEADAQTITTVALQLKNLGRETTVNTVE